MRGVNDSFERQHPRTPDGRFTHKGGAESSGVTLGGISSDNTLCRDGVDDGKIRYSFLGGWEEADKTFTERLEHVPTRFYSYNIPHKVGLPEDFSDICLSKTEESMLRFKWSDGSFESALTRMVSQPKDAIELSDSEALQLCHQLNLEDPRWVNTVKGDAIVASYNGNNIMIYEDSFGKNFGRYCYRGGFEFVPDNEAAAMFEGVRSMNDIRELLSHMDGVDDIRVRSWTDRDGVTHQTRIDYVRDGVPCVVSYHESTGMMSYTRLVPPPMKGEVMNTDVRSLVGAARLHRITGMSVFDTRGAGEVSDRMRLVYELQRAQGFGSAVLSNRKYVSDSRKKIATVWDDKKNPDKTHQHLSKTSVLTSSFAKIEVDNDVDPVEFHDFESALVHAQRVLPPIPRGRNPQLRIRKLGKHRASGLYSPAHNAIAIDVRDSSSFVHEYAHMLDYQGSVSSVGDEFRGVVKDYSSALKVPSLDKGKREYYSTPTEVWARAFELYAREELGIRSRVVGAADSYVGFDYAPFVQNPVLKERAFKIFRSLH